MLLSEPTASEFRRAPCTRGGHHAYLGGLIEHTVAVGTLVGEVCQLHPRLGLRETPMAAALVHDVGKVREFSYGAEFELTEEGRLLGHLALGAEDIVTAASAGLDAERRAALLHCLLTHHGADGVRVAGAGGGRGRAAASARPRLLRSTASTRSTPASRARSSTASEPLAAAVGIGRGLALTR